MRAGVLTWLALRELWISFRFLGLLTLGLVGGLLVALAPQVLGGGTAALAWGIAASGMVGAGVAAATVAAERQRGTLAWLAVRSVSRPAMLLAWFGSIALPLVVGMIGSGVLGWLEIGTSATLGGQAYAALTAAGAVGAFSGIACGVLIGAFLRPIPAALVSVTVAGALLLAGLATAAGLPRLPTAGIGLLANAEALQRPLSDGLQSLGIALAAVGVLLALASAVITRVDL